MIRKLGTTHDFVMHARRLGVDLRLDIKSSGLQIYWQYSARAASIDLPAAMKKIKQDFNTKGITANHHFSKKR